MILLGLISIFFFALSKRLFVYEHFRHGARGPCDGLDENNLDYLKIKWDTLGELSPIGMRMHYLLGYRNKLRYKDFLSEQYDPREMLIISTDVNRTIHSAIANLQGMYPPSTGPTLSESQIIKSVPPNDVTSLKEVITQLGSFGLPNQMQTIPYHIFFQDKHDFQLHEVDNCNQIISIRNENKKKLHIVKAAESFHNTYFKPLNEYYHYTDPNQLLNWTYVNYWCDHFVSDYTEGRDLSAFTNLGIQLDIMETTCQHVLYYQLYDVVFGNLDQQVAMMAMTRPMKKILSNIEARIKLDKEGKSDKKDYSAPRFLIHSGHDTTLAGVVVFLNTAFGITTTLKDFNPKYASNIYLELMKKDTDLKGDDTDYYVDYYFEDRLVKTIPFPEFEKIKTLLWEEKKIDDFCGFSQTNPENTFAYWIVIGFLIAIVVGLSIAVTWMCCSNKNRNSIRTILPEEGINI